MSGTVNLNATCHMDMIDPLYVASGFDVGLLVGMTGPRRRVAMMPLGWRQG